MKHTTTTIDKIAWAISGGLIVLGTIVLGLIEIATGHPYNPAPLEQTNDAGEVINTLYPTVDPTIRTGLVLAGILILLLWGFYQMTTPVSDTRSEPTNVTAD